MNDAVNHPSHYTQGSIECIEGIKASLGDGFVDYCVGNCIKYLWRYKGKNGLEDLQKCKVYLNWAIESFNTEETEVEIRMRQWFEDQD